MQKLPVNNFAVIESAYGKFVVNRHCQFHAEYLIKNGVPHIEPELQGILGIVNILPESSVIVDAGANIGLVAIPMAQNLKPRGGTVYAFEVQRMLAYALSGAAALNDLENLHVFHRGLGAKPGTINIRMADYGAPQDLGMFSLVKSNAGHIRAKAETPEETIEITTIDALNLPRLDFIKVDVEGMDIDVLAGARSMIKTNRPWCWVEYWGVSVEGIKEQFAGLAYRFFLINERDMLCAPTERMATSQVTVNAQEV